MALEIANGSSPDNHINRDESIVHLLALGSSDFVLILTSIVLFTLVVVYSLVLLIRNHNKISKEQSSDEIRRRTKLCQICVESTKQNRTTGKHEEEEEAISCKSIYRKLFNSQVPINSTCVSCGTLIGSPAPRQVSSSNCAGRWNRHAKEATNKCYGTTALNISNSSSNGHPIIFGKSKDSIVVPNLVKDEDLISGNSKRADADSISSSCINQQQDSSGQKQQQQCDIHTSCYKTKCREHTNTSSRVLTDEKGHSIKIRIASPPPPQRHKQIEFMEQLRQQQAQQQQQHQQQKRDSLHSISQFSDSPLLCGGGASDAGACPAGRDKLSSWNGDEEDDEAGATEGRQRTTWVTFDISDDDDDALGADENSDDDDNDDNRCSKMTANGSGDKNGECSTRTKKATAEASGATTTATTPIDSSFDDATTTTTTSEFEDATSNAWDSRQEDTSLEYAKSVASVESAGGSVHNNGRRPMAPEVDAARAATRQASNESVMDSDLRSANRRSLRRALDLSMQSTDESAVSLNRRAAANGWSAHRSVSSRSNLSHTFADQQSTGAFPQSGTLRPVSSSSLAASMMTNEEPTLSTNHCNSPGSAMQTSGRCQQQQQQQQQANCCHHHYCTPHNRTHRLSSETNDSGLSSCCATASAATESRRSSSTTSAGSGLFAAVRRASGSCGPSHCVEPPMRSQHSSLLVSIVRLPAQQSPKRPASSSAASLMNAFKSLTRSRSADVDATLEQPETGPKIDAATTSGQSESHSEPIYEITLIEAFNLPIYANWSASASQSARNTPTRASMQVESMPATPVRPLQGRGGASNDERRRDSLLGSLVGGAASANRSGGGGGGPFKRGGANRHTIAATEAQVGVFVRVFKMTNGASLKPEVGQVEESRSDAQTKKRKRPTDYVELPFVELRRSSATGSELGSNVSFAKRSKEEECDASDERPDQRVSSQSSIASKDQEQRYSITCRESEFPLRVTLYQSSMKRSSSQHQHQHQQTTSARYTLGHCVIEPSDWLDRDDIAAESSSTGSGKCTLVQSSSAEGESDSTVMWSQASSLSKDEDHESEGSCNEADNNGPEVERQTNNKQHRVEYRLYATLLEAIKSA